MWKCDRRQKLSIFNFFEKKKLRNFYRNEADKRSLLFSLPFLKVLERYFHYKKSYMGEKKLITWSRGPPRTWP